MFPFTIHRKDGLYMFTAWVCDSAGDVKRTKVYYCNPYNACERGSNENANKLIRRWIPKGSHISKFTDKYIQDLQDWINTYPRKIFDYLSSQEYKQLVLAS